MFLAAGGQSSTYIPALNDRPDHIAALTAIVLNHLQGWELATPATAPEHYQKQQTSDS